MSTPKNGSVADLSRLLGDDAAELACGQDVHQLLEQVAEGHADELNDHQRDCPHCQAALARFAERWGPVRKLAAEPGTVPAALVDAVTARVRRLVADVWYTLQLTDGGAISVAARVVATIARDAARQVPGVRVALGRSTHARIAALVEKATFNHRHPHAAVGVLGRTAVADLALAVQYGEEVHTVARRVQQQVIADLQRSVGLQTVVVNVTVDDVLS